MLEFVDEFGWLRRPENEGPGEQIRRGVFVLPAPPQTGPVTEIEVRTEELPRWQPRITIERRWVEDDDA